MITSGQLTFWHSVLYVCTHVSVSAVCFAMAATHSEETTEQAIRSVCERVGITSLKEKQREALKAIVCNKKDTFICLPTGYGKSLCYALLPLLFDKLLCREDGTSIVICISPLTAIMMEQRNKYVHSGISAEFIGEMQQDLDSMELVREGKVQLVYISPESLVENPQWRTMLLSAPYQKHLVAIAVDEAHCIVRW